mgnify:CR=1 FL=1
MLAKSLQNVSTFIYAIAPLIGTVLTITGIALLFYALACYIRKTPSKTKHVYLVISIILMFIGNLTQPIGRTFGWSNTVSKRVLNPKPILEGP